MKARAPLSESCPAWTRRPSSSYTATGLDPVASPMTASGWSLYNAVMPSAAVRAPSSGESTMMTSTDLLCSWLLVRLTLERLDEPARDGSGMGDRGTHHDRERSGLEGLPGLCRGVHPALSKQRYVGKPVCDRGDELEVRAFGAVPVRGVAGQRRAQHIGAGLAGSNSVLETAAVGHHHGVAACVDVVDDLGQREPVGSAAPSAVDGNHLRTRLCDRQRVLKGRRDEDVVGVPVLPQTDDGHRQALADERYALGPLGADADGTAHAGGLRELRHGLGMTHRLARIGLAGHHQTTAQGLHDIAHDAGTLADRASVPRQARCAAPTRAAALPSSADRTGTWPTMSISSERNAASIGSHHTSPASARPPPTTTTSGSDNMMKPATQAPRADAASRTARDATEPSRRRRSTTSRVSATAVSPPRKW